MKLIIAGGSGYLGTVLRTYFTKLGYEVIILSRQPKDKAHQKWDAVNLGDWTNAIEGADVLINLTGKSVDCRYTEKNKKIILESRIKSTEVLQKALEGLNKRPSVWINASSATIYEDSRTQLMSEKDGIIGDDFSMNVCKSWEKSFFKTHLPNTRKVAARISIVLGKSGGAFPKIKTLAKLGMGGKVGKGDQKVSWIHEEDLCRAFEFLISNHTIYGPINLTAPEPLDNNIFQGIIREESSVRFGLNMPEWLLKLGAVLIRTEPELLLKSRNVIPAALQKMGFTFLYPNAKAAIRQLSQ